MARPMYLYAIGGRRWVYVGVSVAPEKRIAQHLKKSDVGLVRRFVHLCRLFGGELRRLEMRPFDFDADLKLEGRTIRSYRDRGFHLLNRNLNGGWPPPPDVVRARIMALSPERRRALADRLNAGLTHLQLSARSKAASQTIPPAKRSEMASLASLALSHEQRVALGRKMGPLVGGKGGRAMWDSLSDEKRLQKMAGMRAAGHTPEANAKRRTTMKGIGNGNFIKGKTQEQIIDGCRKAGAKSAPVVNHLRWHVGRGKTSPTCGLCK